MAQKTDHKKEEKPSKDHFIKLCLWNCFHISRHTFVAFIIILAVFLSIARVVLPEIGTYRQNIETAVSEALEQPVRITELKARWYRFGPRLEIHGLELLDSTAKHTLLNFEKALIGLDLLESLRRWDITLDQLDLSIDQLDLQRNKQGELLLKDLNFTPEKATDDQQGVEALRWLLRQEHINIEVKKLLWTDQLMESHQLTFQDAQIETRNIKGHHQLTAKISLPNNLGKQLSFALDGTGDLSKLDQWSGQIYIEGTNINLQEWLKIATPKQQIMLAGKIDFKLWSHWEKSTITSATGTLNGENIHLDTPQTDSKNYKRRPFLADQLSGNFAWLRQKEGFRVDIDQFILKRNKHTWPKSQFSLKKNSSQPSEHYIARSSFFRLDDLRDLLLSSGLLDQESTKKLKNLQPSGAFSNTYLQYQQADKSTPKTFLFQSKFKNLTTRFNHPIPGIENLNGSIVLNQQAGILDINSHNVKLDTGTLFREKLPMDLLSGRLYWEKNILGWRIQSNDIVLKNSDITARGSMFLELPTDHSHPFLEIFANFSDGDAKQISRYLPVGIMPEDAVTWLDSAIIDGTVTHGSVLFHGPLKGFPFRKNQGHFEVRFNAENATLDYLDHWPRLEALQLEAVFKGSGMEINTTSGQLLNSRLRDVSALIPDFKEKPLNLTINGYVDGPLSDTLKFLKESPLKAQFGTFATSSEATGSSQLHLQLDLPIAPTGHKVNGEITFNNNTLLLAEGAVDLEQLQGMLVFSEQGIYSPGIQGQLLGMETELVIRTHHDNQKNSIIQFTADGTVDAVQLSKIIHLPDSRFLQGKTDWHARLQLTSEIGENKPPDVNLHVESLLKGLAVTLPYPLKKQANEARTFILEMGLLGGALKDPVALRYGEKINGMFLRDTTQDTLVWERGELRLGDDYASLPIEPQLRIVGSLPKLSITDWMSVLPESTDQKSDTNLPHHLDLHVDSLEAFGQHFEQSSISVDKTKQAWQVDIDSTQIKGMISLPRQTTLPIIMNLEYLELKSQKESETQSASSPQTAPEKIPPLQVTSHKLIYNGNDFGALKFTSTPQKSGIHFEKITLDSSHTKITAQGDWLNINGQQKTDFEIDLKTNRLPKTLSLFDVVMPIKGGKGRVKISANWLGSPTDFDITRFRGNLNINIKDGQLTEIQPGAGRIVSLLSLQALPKRLTLDFRDLFGKGLKFDKITGDYKIDMGNAFTKNLVMTSSAAKVKMIGRIGLTDEDYNQQVLVTPKVSSILPVVGAIAAGSSWMGAGAAVLIFQKVFLPEFDTIASTEYRVTGSWNEPVIEKVSTYKIPEKKQADK
ncbi:MAG: TIGR02099 family protein [Gammaproteobacteria bacterium]|nr:TIGR02099 family protein [Gammaproteobacteria bacterium]